MPSDSHEIDIPRPLLTDREFILMAAKLMAAKKRVEASINTPLRLSSANLDEFKHRIHPSGRKNDNSAPLSFESEIFLLAIGLDLLNEVKSLRECLQLLVDNQNDCPLPKYEREWTYAMETAEKLLSKNER